jgi:hypothetical protein|tara:strand:- start:188 stop:532 length:345 start_codon:yes stop_codon:yes gene_type:complete
MKIQSESQYIVPGLDVISGDIVKFMDEGEYVEDRFNAGRKKLQIKVEGSFGEKIMTLNGTSVKTIAQGYGYDTATWAGKEAEVEINQAMVAGQSRKIMTLKIPNKDAQGNVVIQ